MKNPILKLLIVIFVVTLTSIAYAQQTGSYTVSYKDVEILQDKFGNASANAVYGVTNNGVYPLFLRSSSCDLVQANGKLVDTISYVMPFPHIIFPGETAYYSKLTKLTNANSRTKLRAEPRITADAIVAQKYYLTTSNIELKEEGIKVKVMGRIKNNHAVNFDGAYVGVVFYGKFNKPVHVASDYITGHVPAGSDFGFDVTTYTIPSELDVRDYKVFAYAIQR